MVRYLSETLARTNLGLHLEGAVRPQNILAVKSSYGLDEADPIAHMVGNITANGTKIRITNGNQSASE